MTTWKQVILFFFFFNNAIALITQKPGIVYLQHGQPFKPAQKKSWQQQAFPQTNKKGEMEFSTISFPETPIELEKLNDGMGGLLDAPVGSGVSALRINSFEKTNGDGHVCMDNIPLNQSCSEMQSATNTKACDYSKMEGKWEGNEWKFDQNICRKLENKDFQGNDNLNKRKFWFLGNSVTRHYAIAFGHLLSGEKDVVESHKDEKQRCKSEVGGDSCNIRRNVFFRWKNSISVDDVFDPNRDFCGRFSNTSQCFEKEFADATVDDILYIQSQPLNIKYERKIHPGGNPGSAKVGEIWVKSAIQNTNVAVVDMVLKAFPGRAIWSSIPAFNMKADKYGIEWNANTCIFRLSEMSQCAIAAVHNPRVTFLNLFPVQSGKFEWYMDMHHHPGRLSEEVLKIVMAMV